MSIKYQRNRRIRNEINQKNQKGKNGQSHFRQQRFQCYNLNANIVKKNNTKSHEKLNAFRISIGKK